MKLNCSELLKAQMEGTKKKPGKKWTAELISVLEKRLGKILFFFASPN